MKRLLFLFTIFIFSILIPYGSDSVSAQVKEIESDINLLELDEVVIDELLNGSESFSIVEDNNDSEVGIRAISLIDFKVGISKQYGGVVGSWRYKSKSTITNVNINLKLNYRENWLKPWTEFSSVRHSYTGGLGLLETNEKTWHPMKKGEYRACANGTIRTIKGTYSMTGCSGTIKYDGSIIIASMKED